MPTRGVADPTRWTKWYDDDADGAGAAHAVARQRRGAVAPSLATGHDARGASGDVRARRAQRPSMPWSSGFSATLGSSLAASTTHRSRRGLSCT